MVCYLVAVLGITGGWHAECSAREYVDLPLHPDTRRPECRLLATGQELIMDRTYGMCRMNPGLAGEFKRTFNRSLHDFWSPVFGFDLIAFGAWIAPPDGVSLKDHLTATVSGSASVLIRRLIGS